MHYVGNNDSRVTLLYNGRAVQSKTWHARQYETAAAYVTTSQPIGGDVLATLSALRVRVILSRLIANVQRVNEFVTS